MGQAKRDATLESKSNRPKLPPKKEPYWSTLGEGRWIGYYRPASKGAGSWLARWRDNETGARKKIKLGSADDFADADGLQILTWTQANAKARAWFDVASHDAVLVAGGEVRRKGPYTVGMAMDDFFDDCELRGVRSLRSIKSAVRVHILPLLSDLPVARLTSKRIEVWKAAVAATPAYAHSKKDAEIRNHRYKEKVPTPEHQRARKETANRLLKILKAALNLALRKHRVPCSGEAWREVKIFKGTSRARIRFLSAEEALRLVNVCKPDFRRLVQGALMTGCRYMELCHLQVSDFNATAGTIFVAPSKSGKSRHVVLTAEGRVFFQSVTAGRPAGEIIFQRDRAVRRERIGLGLSWGPSEQTRSLGAACEAAKLEFLCFHELRHSYASMLVNKGVPLAYVAAQLGHSDTRMVERHYSHLAPSALADSIRALMPTLGFVDEPKVEPLRIGG